MLAQGTAQDAMTYFLEMLSLCLQKHIPYRKTVQKKSSHPWINARCEDAIAKKNAAEGSDDFEAQRKKCSETLAEEYQNYLVLLREKIASMSRWSRLRGSGASWVRIFEPLRLLLSAKNKHILFGSKKTYTLIHLPARSH